MTLTKSRGLKEQLARLEAMKGDHAAIVTLGEQGVKSNPKWLYDFMDQRNAERRLASSYVPHHHGDVWDGARWCAANIEQTKNTRSEKLPIVMPSSVHFPNIATLMFVLNALKEQRIPGVTR